MNELPQIEKLHLLHESHRSKLFTGKSETSNTVLIKEDLTGDLGRLHNEASISTRSFHAQVNSQVMLYNGRLVMVRDFIEGKPLKDLIPEKGFEPREFLQLAILICHEVQNLHQQGILHNDINPKNIIVDERLQNCTLIDYEFGSSIENLELQFEPIPLINGTIEYISPEQTGRMNRKQDQRSDYYSLGATFYEMLTGVTPFVEKDVLTLIHCHLAINPVAPGVHNSKIPATLDKIILKLLAKTAEERYQSIPGLLVDFNHCLDDLNSFGEIRDLEPGKTDIASKLHISQKLYGREEEINWLQERFEDTLAGKKILLTIGGYSGVGKSVLCQELYRNTSSKNGIFLSGAFDILDRQTPYLAFIKAFRQFADWLIVESPSIQKYWSKKLNKDLKGLGQIIIDLAPNLKHILPPQPELVQLTGYENQQRIQFTINSFLQSLASESTPLVLFLDDYQWANDASIELLKSLFNNYNLTHLMILVSYRDNEVSEFHPFTQAINSIKKNNLDQNYLIIQEIHLQPLDARHVASLVSDTLQLESLEVAELAELIYEKTKGNAFSLNKFLESLYTQKLLLFDYQSNKWTWDIRTIKAQNLSENIVDLLLMRIRKLPEEALHVIKAASVFGIEFSLFQLSIITEKSSTSVHQYLWPLIQEGSLIPMGNDYRYIPEFYGETNKDVKFRFAHARIQQAVYALLEKKEESRFHFEVGQIYLKRLSPEQIQEKPIEIALHFALGYDQVNKASNKAEIGRLLLDASAKSAQSASFEGALNFAEKAFEILKEQLNSEEKFQVMISALEYSYLLKDEEQQKKFETLSFAEAKSILHRIMVNEVIVRCLGFANLPKKAVTVAQKALLEVGINIPEKASKVQVIYHAIKIQMALPRAKLNMLKDIPETTDPLTLATFKLLLASLSSYFFVNIDTYPILIFKMIQLTLKKGMAPESVIGIASYGLILTTALKKPADGYEVVKNSIELLNRPDRMKYAATINMMYVSFTSHIKNNVVDSIPLTYEGYLKGLEFGNMEYACWNLFFRNALRFHVGTDFVAHQKDVIETGKFALQYNFGNQNAITQIVEKCIQVTIEEERNIEQALIDLPKKTEENFRTAIRENNNIYLLSYHGYFGCTYLLFSKHNEAFDHFENFLNHIKNQPTSFFIIFYKISRAINACFLLHQIRETKYRNINLKGIIKETISELEFLSKLNPLCYSPFIQYFEAELDYFTTKKLDTQKFEHALNQIKELRHTRYFILLTEAYSNHLLEQNHPKFDSWRNQAASEAKRIGIRAKAKQLLSQEKEISSEGKIEGIQSGLPVSSMELGQIDTKTLVKTMDALVGEIKLEALLEKLITYAMENTGAQEGHFLINRNKNWIVEVSTQANHSLHTQFPKVELEKYHEVSASVVNYAKATKEPLLIEDAMVTKPFDTDFVVRNKNLRSILCIPFISQSKISGMIYLTHSQTSNAFQKGHISLMRLMAGQIGGIIENALLYENMENLVKERTRELEEEKQKSDSLLLNILPKEIASELILKGKASARLYDHVSVMFIDIKDFTTIAQAMTPDNLVKNLHEFFTKFDEIMDEFGLEKIKTIGDAYMAAGGIPTPSSDHAVRMVNAGLKILEFVESYNKERVSKEKAPFAIRIGIHSGPVVAGVVGSRKFAYDIWGDTVNIASRMESNGEPGKINISEDHYQVIADQFECEHRGKIPVKNKGVMNMYFVNHPKIKEA